MPKERTELKVASERAVLAAVRLPDSNYDPRDPFGELRALAEQGGAVVVGECSQRLERPVAGTYIGSGKITELKGLCDELEATTIIFDHDLSPKQISNIEKGTGRKVVDRSELILDIFAGRATTNEAKLQVELAQLEYTYPRLKAMWDHLERIVGGGGIAGIGTRGPGEQQLEIDRRLVQRRKLALQHDLAIIQARRRREVAARKREHFTVGIVGYTNAGKSTLFNTLTAGGAYADDRPFATLMTRTRQWDAGHGVGVMLSDTVGFVRDIPHHLVASFKATLEEATHADLLLIVLDVSDPAAELQLKTVNTVLDELFDEMEKSKHAEDKVARPERILLLNKVDRLKDNSELLVWQRKAAGSIAICALPGKDGRPRLGAEELTRRVLEAAQGGVDEFLVTVPLKDSKTVTLIEKRGEILGRTYTGDSVTLRARIGRRQLAQLRSAGARLELADAQGREVPRGSLPGEPVETGWSAAR
ncbi:GTPase HflX [Phycisphaerales bacterium]|nr:GTPase HflX [Phycisphaerales bacterium]